MEELVQDEYLIQDSASAASIASLGIANEMANARSLYFKNEVASTVAARDAAVAEEKARAYKAEAELRLRDAELRHAKGVLGEAEAREAALNVRKIELEQSLAAAAEAEKRSQQLMHEATQLIPFRRQAYDQQPVWTSLQLEVVCPLDWMAGRRRRSTARSHSPPSPLHHDLRRWLVLARRASHRRGDRPPFAKASPPQAEQQLSQSHRGRHRVHGPQGRPILLERRAIMEAMLMRSVRMRCSSSWCTSSGRDPRRRGLIRGWFYGKICMK